MSPPPLSHGTPPATHRPHSTSHILHPTPLIPHYLLPVAKDGVGKVKDISDDGRVAVWFGEAEGVWTGTVAEICLVTNPEQVSQAWRQRARLG